MASHETDIIIQLLSYFTGIGITKKELFEQYYWEDLRGIIETRYQQATGREEGMAYDEEGNAVGVDMDILLEEMGKGKK